MKGTFIFALLVCSFIQAQTFKIKIIDSEDQKNISGARIISNNQVYYTNEDGIALLPSDAKNLNVTASGYVDLDKTPLKESISLKPQYRNIDEVKIVSIDLTKFLQNVLKRYHKVYYMKPAVYDITYWQRSYENNQLKNLIVADGKFWSREGEYNYKESYQNQHNQFVQLQPENLRFNKFEPFESKLKVKKENQSNDYIGDLFFNYELNRLIRFSKSKNAKVSGKVVFEDAEKQEIFYSIKTERNLIYTGTIRFDKKDQAITYLHLDFKQDGAKPYQLEDENGVKYEHQLGNGRILFEFYKNGNLYVPSKVAQNGSGFKFKTENNEYEYRSAREIVFKNFKEGTTKGLEKPVNLFSPFWNDFKVNADKGLINLTKEEQEFINEQDHEN